MITFDSIRIRNFRAIKELTFKPETHGITGIFGSNGQGKTSILMAVLFALFGVRPKDVSVQSLRKIGSGKEECSVSVVFTHLNQKVEIIRELKGANNNVIVNIYVDGNKESVTSVGAANRWINKRLGVNAEGFLTAFTVRQKELDSFVRAVPSERKRIIERLAGVDTINEAVKLARVKENDSRKTVELLPGSEESAAAAGDEVDFWSDKYDTTKEDLATAQQSLRNLQADRSNQTKELNRLRSLEAEYVRVEAEMRNIDTELRGIDGNLERVAYVLNMDSKTDIDAIRERYREISRILEGKRTEQANAQARKGQTEKELSRLTAQVDKASHDLSLLPEIDMTIEQITAAQSQNVIKIDAANRLVDLLRATSADLEESISALDGSECPTCKSHLDDPTALVERFRGTIQVNNEKIADQGTIIAEASAGNQELTGKLTALTVRLDLETTVETLSTAKAELEESLASFVIPEVDNDEVKELLEEQRKITELGQQAKTFDQDFQAHTKLTARATELKSAYEDQVVRFSQISADFSPKRLEELDRSLTQSQGEFERVSSQASELSGSFREAEIRFNNAKTNYTRLTDQWNRKKTLVEAHAQHTLTTDMLETFRQETVASIAPELSEYATSLISDMTNGDFVEVSLDDEFKASLIDKNGVERQSSWLSGGEESALALALRLATAFLITGGNSELLWLDEPLTAQDAERRSAILSMIRKLPIKQIILINHAQEAADIVDHEITLTGNNDLDFTAPDADVVYDGQYDLEDIDSSSEES